METGFITPIQLIGSVSTPQQTQQVSGADGSSIFKDLFTNMADNVTESEKNLEQQQYLLATGQIDDAHTVPIAAAQAQMSVDMLVQLRNKALDSYNELMRTSV